MRYIFNIFSSIRKSFIIRKMQKRLHPQNDKKQLSDLMDIKNWNKKDKFLEQYINFCYNDKNIYPVVTKYNIAQKGLKEIYYTLMMSGAGQWVKGHFVALSVIAYQEPLLFFLLAKGNGKLSDLEITTILLDYFESTPGHLLEKLN